MEAGRARTAGIVVYRLLSAAWFVLLAGGGIATVLILVVVARGGHPRVDFPVALSLQGGSVVGRATGSASVLEAGGRLSVNASTEVVIAGLVFALAGLGLTLGVLRQLRALVADAIAGSPFGASSAHRVRLIGAAVIGADLVGALVVLAGSLWARGHVQIQGLTFRASFPVHVTVLGSGVLVILLAEVFRVGAALQRDHDLTV